MKTPHEHLDQTTPEAGTATEGKTPTDSQANMSRRAALAIVGKHAVYTAPAVLAVLSVAKSKSAHAGSF